MQDGISRTINLTTLVLGKKHLTLEFLVRITITKEDVRGEGFASLPANRHENREQTPSREDSGELHQPLE